MSKRKMMFMGVVVLGAASVCAGSVAARSTPVTVVNSDSEPVPVTIQNDADRVPFQGTMSISRSGSDAPVYDPLTPAVGPGMILTIEYVSGKCSTGELSKVFNPAIRTTFQGVEIVHNLVPHLVNTITSNDYQQLRYVFNQNTIILADTDYPIQASYSQVFLGGDWPSVGCTYIISGYLESP